MFLNPETALKDFPLAEGMRVADFGTGSGFYALAAARRVGDEGTVYALDIQEGLLTRLKDGARRAGLRNIKTLVGELEQSGGSKLRAASMDAVIMSNILFQVEHRESLLREAARVLKPSGRIFLVDWTGSFGGLGPRPDDVVAEDRARTLLEGVGFRIERSVEAGAHHYGLVARK